MSSLSIAVQRRDAEVAKLIHTRDLDRLHVNDGLIQSLGAGGSVAKMALDQAKMRQANVDQQSARIAELQALTGDALTARYFPEPSPDVQAALRAGVTFVDSLARGALV